MGDVAVADLDAVDHGVVEQLAGSWVGVAVGGGAVGGEPPGGLEDGLPLVQVGSEGAAAGFKGRETFFCQEGESCLQSAL